MSVISIGIGSVGISLAPIRVTTLFTSGNFFNSVTALVVASTVSCKLLPVINRASIAKSPSSSSGINSPPKVDATKRDNTNKRRDPVITLAGWSRNLERIILKYCCNLCMSLSEKFSFSGTFLLSVKLVSIGT